MLAHLELFGIDINSAIIYPKQVNRASSSTRESARISAYSKQTISCSRTIIC